MSDDTFSKRSYYPTEATKLGFLMISKFDLLIFNSFCFNPAMNFEFPKFCNSFKLKNNLIYSQFECFQYYWRSNLKTRKACTWKDFWRLNKTALSCWCLIVGFQFKDFHVFILCIVCTTTDHKLQCWFISLHSTSIFNSLEMHNLKAASSIICFHW